MKLPDVPLAPGRRRLFELTGAAALAAAFGMLGAARAQTPRVIPVRARRFVFTPNRIPLKPGETVVFELTSDDVPMGFAIPDLGVRADVVPGQVTRLTATAQKTGSFTFLCDVFCGSGHENMNGTIEVA